MEHEHIHNDDSLTPIKELIVLIRYLIKHNESHTKELEELALELKKQEFFDAYDDVMDAIREYDKGNKKLSDALRKVIGD